MTLQELTAQLERLYESQRRFSFVQQAHRALSAMPAAPDLAKLTFRALTEMGFAGPATELLQFRRDLCADDEERGRLRSSLDGVPNGRVPWREQAPVFRRNLAALVSGRPEFSEWAQSLPRLLGSVHLHRSRQGQYLLSRREAGALREWLADLSAAEQERDLQLPPREQLGVTAVVGLRVGSVLERIHDDTHRLYLSYSHPIYLIEPDPVHFSAALHCADLSRLLADDRVYVFVGADAVDRFHQLLSAEADLPVPTLLVNLTGDPAPFEQLHDTCSRLTSEREAELKRLTAEIETRYRDRDAAYWTEHFRPPGRVLGFTSRFTTVLQYSMRDTLHALGEMGYEPHMLLEANDHHTTSLLTICRKLLEVDPVLLVCLDHLRYEQPNLPRNLPLLTWIQDPMPNLFCRRAGESIGPFDFVCGYYDTRCINEFGYPENRFKFAGIPVSTRVFHDGEPDEASAAKYACDICFVSHCQGTPDELYQSALAEYPSALGPLLEALYEDVTRLLDEDGYMEVDTSTDDFVRSTADRLGVTLTAEDVDNIQARFAHRLFDMQRRQQALEWVANWARRTGRTLKIYGRGWDKLPHLAEFAAGVVEHGEPLRQVYRNARLALQLIPAGFRHQRALEALASGTLPLTRYCPVDFKGLPIETYVSQREAGQHADGFATIFPGLERVVFRTAAEFETLAERYLGCESLRQNVASELRNVVLRKFTYAAVLPEIIEPFRKEIERLTARQEGASPTTVLEHGVHVSP